MRDDLAKCTTERERRGGGFAACYKLKFGGKVRIDPDPEHEYPDEFGGFHSSARRRHYEHKEFSDVLNPLRGNLRAAIGKRWDDVYSEFANKLDRRSLSGYHIWTHLMQEISVNTYIEDGRIYEISKYGGNRYEVTGFYVHPITGIVQYAERPWTKRSFRERRKQKREPEFAVPGNEGWKYKRCDGLWFRCREVERRNVYGGKEILIEKRSANKREIAWIKTQLQP
jgi:hypothetical protein